MLVNTVTQTQQEVALPSDRYFSRFGSIAAILGAVVYAISAILHPWTPPHETHAAFTDYAGESHWALFHLGELLGFLLMTAAVIALASRLRHGKSGVWATLGATAVIIAAAVYAIFIAVDGVALGLLVDRWAAAGPDSKTLLYETAYAVRQIEGGLFSIQWLMFGIGTGLLAGAFFTQSGTPALSRWHTGMGWLSILAGIGALSFGIVQAQTGYTDLSMAFQMGLYVGVVWIIAVGVFLYRHPEHGEYGTENNYLTGNE